MREIVRTMGALVGEDPLDPCVRACAAHLDTGGKRIRALLALEAGRALGVPVRQIQPWAAAVELLHNASLVHDDVQDAAPMRRGLPALWAAQGMPQAIAAGDLLLALSTLAVGEIPVGGDLRWALARLLAQATADAARGQSLELDLRPRRLLGWDAYLRAVDGKAGALFALPVQGALALCRHERAAELAIPFRILGTLYQLRDDVLDLYGTGIEGGGNDLREGRVTALVVAHLECRPHDRDWLLAILDRPREGTGEAHLAMASRRFEESGALAAVVERVEKLADTVRQHPAWVHAPGLAPLACSVVEDLLGPVAELGYAA